MTIDSDGFTITSYIVHNVIKHPSLLTIIGPPLPIGQGIGWKKYLSIPWNNVTEIYLYTEIREIRYRGVCVKHVTKLISITINSNEIYFLNLANIKEEPEKVFHMMNKYYKKSEHLLNKKDNLNKMIFMSRSIPSLLRWGLGGPTIVVLSLITLILRFNSGREFDFPYNKFFDFSLFGSLIWYCWSWLALSDDPDKTSMINFLLIPIILVLTGIALSIGLGVELDYIFLFVIFIPISLTVCFIVFLNRHERLVLDSEGFFNYTKVGGIAYFVAWSNIETIFTYTPPPKRSQKEKTYIAVQFKNINEIPPKSFRQKKIGEIPSILLHLDYSKTKLKQICTTMNKYLNTYNNS